MAIPYLAPELVALIVHQLYLILLPPLSAAPSPDPNLTLLPPPPEPAPKTFLGPTQPKASGYPYPTRPTRASPVLFAPPALTVARNALLSLCLVNSTWNHEATKYLWRSVSFGLPRGFETVLQTALEYSGHVVEAGETKALERLRLDDGARPGGAVDALPDLSEDGKWAKMAGSGRKDGKMVDDGSEDLAVSPTSIVHPPTLEPSESPLLHIYVISFSGFRTAGLRRSLSQGTRERFVTPARLLTILRGTRYGVAQLLKPAPLGLEDSDEVNAAVDERHPKGRLEAAGFTEFMDSALTKAVLEELLLRGGYLATYSLPAPPPPAPTHIHSPSISFSLPPPPLERPSARGRERVLQAFRAARDLQSSRSPTRVPEAAVEEEDEDIELHSEDEEVAVSSDEEAVRMTPFPPRVASRRASNSAVSRRERRSSGAAFAGRGAAGVVEKAGEEEEEEEEERGRDHRGRTIVHAASLAARSSSVPAAVFLRQTTPVGLGTRSSSVPAVGREEEPAREREVTTLLEGSTTVRPLRALDLCGCISSTFVHAVGELIEEYRLDRGDKAKADDAMDVDERDDADDDIRKLVRVQFPHLRRLGLASSLLPAPQLTSLVTAFPFLTHLDLTSTLTSPLLLYHLALAGQSGPGGRSMRLKSLSLARCRLMTGAALVGLLCGDCPPFTSIPSTTSSSADDPSNASAPGSWGSGAVVSTLTDLSLFGDSTYPSPLTQPELHLIVTRSPAFTPTPTLRSLDLSSTPLTDSFLAVSFPALPHLQELGLANCRLITFRGVGQLLEDRVPGVEVLDLSGSCLFLAGPGGAALGRRVGAGVSVSTMELHGTLLGRVASVEKSSEDAEEERHKLARRKTNLRVVEMGQKALESVQGGAGDWKVVWGKGRRGWYVDIGVKSVPNPPDSESTRPRTLVHLPRTDPTRIALQKLVDARGVVAGETGWHPHKMEVLLGDGMMGREDGLYGFHSFQV